MKNWKISLVVALAAWFSASGLLGQQIDPDFVDGKIYLKERTAINETVWRDLADRFGIFSKTAPFRTAGFERVYALRFTEIAEVGALVRELNALSEVEYAEKVPLYKTFHTPDDIHSNQWTIGKVQAEKAWDITRGSRDVKVAVIDDGFFVNHEDLIGQVYTNPGEIAGDGIDNDGNGYIDDVTGYDVADDDSDPSPPNGAGWGMAHGTHVAGITLATTNNSRGMASIAYDCSFIPIKAKHDTTIGQPQIDASAEGMDYAINSGAKVVNMSFGGSGFSQTIQSLISAGYWQGMIWVAASGNNGQWQGFFPSGYANVISVSSTDYSDVKSGFSNWHPTVDVCAPGGGIWSAFVSGTNGYTYMSGTSMASPNAASLVALMLSINPQLSPDDAERCLEEGCDDISAMNPGLDGLLGAGRINAFNSVMCVPRLEAPIADFTFPKDTLCIGEFMDFEDLSLEFPQHWLWDFGDGQADTTMLMASHAYSAAGTYSVTLIVSNNIGADTLTFVDAVTVLPGPAVAISPGILNANGDSISLAATGCANPTWSPGTGLSCTNCSSPMLSIADMASSYTVSCTDDYGCSGMDTLNTDVLIAVGDAVVSDLVIGTPYPQPAEDRITLQAEFAKPGQLRVGLVDLYGRELAVLVEEKAQGSFQRMVNLPQGLASGMYLLRWQFENAVQVQRVALGFEAQK